MVGLASGIFRVSENRQGGADLHAHTSSSDGVLTPGEMVLAAVEAELQAVAITDHDTLAGIGAARAEAQQQPIDLVAGIEISVRLRNLEIHLLGLFIDESCSQLRQLSLSSRRARRERAERMVERARSLRLDLSMQHIVQVAGSATIGRPHVAAAMVAAGIVPSPEIAFRRYLGTGRPLAVPRELIGAPEAIGIIHRAGGIAVVAHPGSSRVRATLLEELSAAGLDAIEVRHPRHGRQREQLLLEQCRRLGLLPSGGSDFHGPGRGTAKLGEYRVPMDWYQPLCRQAQERKAQAVAKE